LGLKGELTTPIQVLPYSTGIAPVSAGSQPPKLSPFLAKHNGAIPDLDVEAFEEYVTQTRNEWENNRTY